MAAANMAQTVLGLSRPKLTPRSNQRMEEIAVRMLSVPDLVCATADQKGILLSLQSLQVRGLGTYVKDDLWGCNHQSQHAWIKMHAARCLPQSLWASPQAPPS